MNNRKLYLLAIIFGVCVAATIYTALSQRGKTKQLPQKPHITTLPKITSCLRGLTVQSAFFRKPDSDSESTELVLQLMNNSDTSVVAISIEWTSKKEKTKASLITESFGADEPKILVMPHSLYEVAIPVENFPPDSSVQVGSVEFADGTEDGCTDSLKALRELKSKSKKESPKDSKEPPR